MDTTVLELREPPARALDATGARLMVRETDDAGFVRHTSLAELEDLLRRGTAFCVIFVLSPVCAVADQLERSVSAQSALDDWQDGLHAILQLWRRHRDRVRIAELPRTSAELPEGDLRRAFDAIAAGDGPLRTDPDRPVEALAGLALGQDLRCRALIDTLAAAQKSGGQGLAPAAALIDALTEWHRQRVEAERDQQSLIDVLADQVADLEQALIGTDTRCKKLVREKRALEAQLQKETGDLQRAIEAIHASTSWRITGPARWVIRRLRR